jgi:hypothetical protein
MTDLYLYVAIVKREPTDACVMPSLALADHWLKVSSA